jgi:hypothetical protein
MTLWQDNSPTLPTHSPSADTITLAADTATYSAETTHQMSHSPCCTFYATVITSGLHKLIDKPFDEQSCDWQTSDKQCIWYYVHTAHRLPIFQHSASTNSQQLIYRHCSSTNTVMLHPSGPTYGPLMRYLPKSHTTLDVAFPNCTLCLMRPFTYMVHLSDIYPYFLIPHFCSHFHATKV